MRFRIVHEIRGRIRIHIEQKRMSFEEADTLQYYLMNQNGIVAVKIYERNQDAVICYKNERQEVLKLLQTFCYEHVDVPEVVLQNSGREMNRKYWDRLVGKVIVRMGSKCFLPYSVRSVITV